MKPVRVMVFDQATSIRALLSRTVEASDTLVCAGCRPISTIREYNLNLGSADAVIIGLDQNEIERVSMLAAAMTRSHIPGVVLVTGEGSLQRSVMWPEECVVLRKPQSTEGWETLCASLVPILEGMGTAFHGFEEHTENTSQSLDEGLDLVAVGGSAGGPEATGEMLQTIGEALERTAVVIVQHIGAGFETEYTQWLAQILPWSDVAVAEDGEPLSRGQIRVAGPASHLEISAGPVCRIDDMSPPCHGHRPSVNHLFQSLAREKPRGSAGVLLSGMGKDGVEGLLDLRRAGCLTLAQDQASSAVFGMPGGAITRGAATIAQPPAILGTILRSHIERGRNR